MPHPVRQHRCPDRLRPLARRQSLYRRPRSATAGSVAAPAAGRGRRKKRAPLSLTSSGRSSSRARRKLLPGRRHHLRRSRRRLLLRGRLADQGFPWSAWKASSTCKGGRCRAFPPIEVCIRSATATAGDAKHVHMVVDFGNSRTGALLLEMTGEITQTPQMTPFELVNRYHLDAWDDEGEFDQHAARPLVLVQDPLVQHALPAAAGAEEERVPHGRGRRRPGLVPRRERSPGRARSRWSSRPTCSTTCRWSAWAARPTTSARSCKPRATSAPASVRPSATSGPTMPAGWKGPTGTWPTRPTAAAPATTPRRCTGRSCVHPRRRPRLPARRRRAGARRIRHRGPASSRATPRGAMMTAALYELLCQAYMLRQLAGLPQRHAATPGAPAKSARLTLTLSQRDDPGGAEAVRRPGPEGDQHLRRDAGQEPAGRARAEPQHRRGQRRPPDLHLERAADARPGSPAVVRHAAPGPRTPAAARSRRPPAPRPPSPAGAGDGGRCGVAASRPGGPARRRARRDRRVRRSRPAKSASPASTSAAARPT